MSKKEYNKTKEILAEECHTLWRDTMRVLFAGGRFNLDGSWTMPVEEVIRRQNLIHTPYIKLNEIQKDFNRLEALEILDLVCGEIKSIWQERKNSDASI